MVRNEPGIHFGLKSSSRCLCHRHISVLPVPLPVQVLLQALLALGILVPVLVQGREQGLVQALESAQVQELGPVLVVKLVPVLVRRYMLQEHIKKL